jgi:hypothetical protein
VTQSQYNHCDHDLAYPTLGYDGHRIVDILHAAASFVASVYRIGSVVIAFP